MGLVEELTNGQVVIGPASLYTIIKKLIREAYITFAEKGIKGCIGWRVWRGVVFGIANIVQKFNIITSAGGRIV